MLRPVAALAVVGVVVVGCGDDVEAPADALADRVVAVLDLEGAEVTCPEVEKPEAGDRATCTAHFDSDRELQVDIEFEADGAFAVVAVVPG